MVQAQKALYSRTEHGVNGTPVAIMQLADGKYQVGDGPSGTNAIYATRRKLLIGLTGHPEARHWTFDRYFRQGKYAIESQEDTILDLFGATPALTLVSSNARPLAFRTGANAPTQLTVVGGSAYKAPGIDLKTKATDVAKLLFAGYGRKIYAYGYDPDDVLQEVYKGLLIRNKGKCPWDPKKSSFGHYVHLVAGCLLSNYHRKQSRIRSMEQVGLLAMNADGEYVSTDAATACDTRVECAVYQDHSDMVDASFVTFLTAKVAKASPQEKAVTAPVLLQILPLAIEGHGRYDIAAALDVPVTHVAKGLKIIKAAMGDWAMQPFIG